MNKQLSIKNTEHTVELENIHSLRYSFMTASLMILGGIILSREVHPYFILLPLLVSFGLLFSGMFGWCPMSLIYERALKKVIHSN